MGLEDAAGRRLAPGGHAAAACPDPGPSAAWRDEPAARRAGRRPAGWPDPETVPEPVDASDRQRRAGPSLAAKKCLCSMVLRPVERLVFSPKER